MSAHHWSGSKVDLGMHCLYWARPEVIHPKRAPGAAAVRGISVHKACENFHTNKPLPELDMDGAAMWLTLHAWLVNHTAPSRVELPLLYDAENDTATICEMGDSERAYLNVTPMTIPMRLDMAWDPNGPEKWTPLVIDLKTGSRSNVEPPATNMQLATQALALSRLVKWAGPIDVGLIFPLKTMVHDDRATLDTDALDAHAGLLHRRLRTLPNAEPVKGSHCWRCPIGPSRDHQAACPAWAKEETNNVASHL